MKTTKFEMAVRTRVVVIKGTRKAMDYCEVLRDMGLDYQAWINEEEIYGDGAYMIAFKADMATYRMVETFVDVEDMIYRFKKGTI